METPSIIAPISTSISHRSMISGSRATLSMTVVPSASTEAISRFSVAPTLGKSSHRLAPVSRPATSATTKPCSMRTSAPELGQPGHVHVQAARADVVAARQRDPGPAAAGDQRAEHADRGAQPADQVVRRDVLELVGHVDGDRPAGVRVDHPAGVLDRDRAAELLEQPGHHVHVEDVGDVGDPGAALGQERGRHQLQGAVLRAADVRGAAQRVRERPLGPDLESLHQADASGRTSRA